MAKKDAEKISNKISSGKNFWAFVLIFPSILFLFVFAIFPFIQNIFYSFTSLGNFGMWEWSGLENYKRLLKDPLVYYGFLNSFKYVLIVVPLATAFSLFAAVLLNTKVKGTGIFRTLLFLPAVTMSAAIGMIWKWLYNKDFGIINYFLSFFGVERISWLGNPQYAIWAIAVAIVWANIAYNMILFLAALQGVPNSYYEVAEIDGAGPIRKFFSVTLPLITPTLFFVVVMLVASTIRVFEIIYAISGSGGGEMNVIERSTNGVVSVFYKYAFYTQEKGYAASIAFVIFIVTSIITLIQMKLQKKWVHY